MLWSIPHTVTIWCPWPGGLQIWWNGWGIGWDDATAVLQLLSHLEGDALNVALLVPASRRASRVGLVDALSAHYGSPGRLADYLQQFERTTRTSREEPSIFVTALETLAIKVFGDMSQTARLRIIRYRFIAGHSSCELRRHLEASALKPEPPTVGQLLQRLLPEGGGGGGGGGVVPKINNICQVAQPINSNSTLFTCMNTCQHHNSTGINLAVQAYINTQLTNCTGRKLQHGQESGPGHRQLQNIRRQSELLRCWSRWPRNDVLRFCSPFQIAWWV